MIKLIWCIRKKGEYNGIPYDKYDLLLNNPDVKISYWFEKISYKDCIDMGFNPETAQGMYLNVAYNRFGRIESISIAD